MRAGDQAISRGISTALIEMTSTRRPLIFPFTIVLQSLPQSYASLLHKCFGFFSHTVPQYCPSRPPILTCVQNLDDIHDPDLLRGSSVSILSKQPIQFFLNGGKQKNFLGLDRACTLANVDTDPIITAEIFFAFFGHRPSTFSTPPLPTTPTPHSQTEFEKRDRQ